MRIKKLQGGIKKKECLFRKVVEKICTKNPDHL